MSKGSVYIKLNIEHQTTIYAINKCLIYLGNGRDELKKLSKGTLNM